MLINWIAPCFDRVGTLSGRGSRSARGQVHAGTHIKSIILAFFIFSMHLQDPSQLNIPGRIRLWLTRALSISLNITISMKRDFQAHAKDTPVTSLIPLVVQTLATYSEKNGNPRSKLTSLYMWYNVL